MDNTSNYSQFIFVSHSSRIFPLYFHTMHVFCIKKFQDISTEFLMFQADRVRDAAWGCDWVGTPVHFQKCIRLIITAANKEFIFTAGKFVPVAISTMMHVRPQSIQKQIITTSEMKSNLTFYIASGGSDVQND